MTSGKLMTVVALLILLSMVVLPATALGAPPPPDPDTVPTVVYGYARIKKPGQPSTRSAFSIYATGTPRRAVGTVYKRNLVTGRVQRIDRVRFVTFRGNTAFLGGLGKGKWSGYYVMIAIEDDDGQDKVWIRRTKSRAYFRNWRQHPHTFGPKFRFRVVRGDLTIQKGP